MRRKYTGLTLDVAEALLHQAWVEQDQAMRDRAALKRRMHDLGRCIQALKDPLDSCISLVHNALKEREGA